MTLVDDAMAKVLRIVTIERGLDPRDFTLVAFGGGGPLHACALATELGIARVVVPARPGLFSAHGLLVAALQRNDVRSVLRSPASSTSADSTTRAASLPSKSRGREALAQQGAESAIDLVPAPVDARYAGQSFELTVAHDCVGATPSRRTFTARTARATATTFPARRSKS